jgi:thioredoxin-related protein
MLRTLWLSIFILGITVGLPSTQAARDLWTTAEPKPNLEMVVLEVSGCIYCNVFRRQLLPTYKASKKAKKIPIRFVDVNDPAVAEIGLTQPVGIVPTFVILENNQEIGRIPGYMSRRDFFRAIDYIVSGRPGL